jgi:hypothetical protein
LQNNPHITHGAMERVCGRAEGFAQKLFVGAVSDREYARTTQSVVWLREIGVGDASHIRLLGKASRRIRLQQSGWPASHAKLRDRVAPSEAERDGQQMAVAIFANR